MIKTMWGSFAKCASSLRLSRAVPRLFTYRACAVSLLWAEPASSSLGERWETVQVALGIGWITEMSTLLALIVPSLTRRKRL